MGGFGYDRQVFVKSQEPAPPPGRSPMPGAIVLILVAALGAFAAYRYIKAGGLSNVDVDSSGGSSAQVKQLQHKIEVLQTRIDELEKRRRPKPLAEDPEADGTKPKLHATLASELAHRSEVPASMTPVQKQPVAVSAEPKTPPATPPANTAKTDENLNLLKGDLATSREEWEATVNRLGNVVGELDAQRNQVKQNQNDVSQLLKISRRTGVSFSLKKGSRFQRVGPISIKLANTDVANQRYTLRLIVDDKSVELKDRALNEVIQFYTMRSQFPVELVVSQIQRGHVEGMLAVPNDLNANAQNAQMQSR
ncbi:MAG TPA: hypothetical protein VMV34_04635 [Terriglobia bacterium]|nr:hypothetical protein [Terriglobia bacterium]